MRTDRLISREDGLAFQSLALRQVSVVTLGEETRLVTSDDALEETGRNLDKGPSEGGYKRTSGPLTLKRRASIVAPDCDLPTDFPTSNPPSLPANLIFRVVMDLETIQLAIKQAMGYVEGYLLPMDVASVPLDRKRVAEHIDHTLLKPDATPEQITALCEEAREYGFKVRSSASYQVKHSLLSRAAV